MKAPSRRSVVRAGVWSVPVVAAAAAAPAFAGTGTPPPVTIDSVGTGCKLPGHSTDTSYGYRMILEFHNTSGSAQAITITDFQIDGKPTTDLAPTSFTVGTGDTFKTFVVQSTSSSQRTATITYTVGGQTYVAVVTFDQFHPCDR